MQLGIWKMIKKDAFYIIQDPFGNYIIQILLELESNCNQIVNEIIEIVTNEIITLSNQKFSSNVVERCIEKSSPVSLIT